MRIEIEPSGMAAPAANYAHAVLVGPARTLYTSGVVPVSEDGSTPPDVAGQATLIWGNIDAILRAAQMSRDDVVNVTTYAVASTTSEELQAIMAARDGFLTHRAASTLLLVAGLARPQWRVEIAVVAAATT